MMKFTALRNSTDFEKAVKQLGMAAIVWLLALLVFLIALSLENYNSTKLEEAVKILNGATVIKAYGNVATAKPEGSTLSSLSELVKSSGLADRVLRLDSNGNDTLFQAERIYPDELGKLVSAIGSAGMQVNSAEIKAAQVKGERLLSVTLSVGGAAK